MTPGGTGNPHSLMGRNTAPALMCGFYRVTDFLRTWRGADHAWT